MNERQTSPEPVPPEPPKTAPVTFAGHSEMAARVNAHDWARTPVGPASGWPQSLKALVKTLLASSYPMVLTWGPELTQFYNDAYSALIGEKHPAALGIDIRITLAEAWDTLGPMIERVMATGVANFTPALMLPLERSGYREEAYFSVSHSPAEDDAGQITGMFAVCSEVTQQVIGARRLRLLRDLASKAGETRTVQETFREIAPIIAEHPLDVPFALFYLRAPDGRTLTLQAAVGLTAGDPAGPLTVDLEAPEAPWPFARAAGGETVLVEDVPARISLRGGLLGDPVRAALIMPIASSGQVAPLGVIVAGLSPNRALDEGYSSFYELLAGQVSIGVRNAQTYEDERRRAEALAKLDKAKTAFFSNVSHEFRTPLTLLLGPVEDALGDAEEPLPERHQRRLELVRRNGLRLLKLVNTLLDFSRVEAGRARATFEPTDLAVLTASLVSLFESTIHNANLTLDVDIEPMSEPVYVDRASWEKITLNLLSNAVKFTFEGRISVAQRATPGFVTLTVRDTGTGIPDDELPHIFERFHRVEGARSRSHEGSGIGLALVQELVHLHGGEITVESALCEGTTFTVTIPRGNAHLDPDHIAPAADVAPERIAEPFILEASRWLPPPAPPATLPDVRPEPGALAESDGPPPTARLLGSEPAIGRILLVDDNADLRDYVTGILGGSFEVMAAVEGISALRIAQTQKPDLVLSDVMMPGMTGFELLRALRADKATQHIPIILLSARAGDESASEGLEAGADDYLVKPFTARELLARVRTHLKLTRMRAQIVRQEATEAALREQVERERRLADERMELLKREQEAVRLAEEAGRLKDEFLATASHELRTPLSAILGWAVLLKGSKRIDPASLTKGLDVIERNARAQQRIVEDILDVSRIVRGTMQIEPELFDIGAVAWEVVDTLRPAAAAKRVTITVEGCDENLPFVGDRQRIRQILSNLVSNAIKFNVPGGDVCLSCGIEEGKLKLLVRDTGKGIDAAFLPYVFERFRQAESSSTRSFGGLGLGLAIVKSVVELHGGAVSVESAGVDKGTTFTVTLPVPPFVTAPERRAGLGNAGEAKGRAGRLGGLSVLVVEDEDDARDLVETVLAMEGARVHAASSAATALDALSTFNADVVVSDIAMSGHSGYWLMEHVREIRPATPGIALTAFARGEDVERVRAAGFVEHLAKPIDPERLVSAVARFGGRRAAGA